MGQREQLQAVTSGTGHALGTGSGTGFQQEQVGHGLGSGTGKEMLVLPQARGQLWKKKPD